MSDPGIIVVCSSFVKRLLYRWTDTKQSDYCFVKCRWHQNTFSSAPPTVWIRFKILWLNQHSWTNFWCLWLWQKEQQAKVVCSLKREVKVTKFCVGREELINVYKLTKFDLWIINGLWGTKLNANCWRPNRQTDWQFFPIHRPDLLCNPVKIWKFCLVFFLLQQSRGICFEQESWTAYGVWITQ